MVLQPREQSGFARTAGSDNTDKRLFTWRLHKGFVMVLSLML
jgi:hypothetical protein